MGFKVVYRSLMELFPQVDGRILKAVAIEHPKNVDSAAEVVISEVLPYLSQKSVVDNPFHEDCSPSGVSSGIVELFEPLRYDQIFLGETIGTSTESRSIANEDACKTTTAAHSSDSTHQEKALNSTSVLSSDTTVDSYHLQGNIESEELILLVRPQCQKDSSQSGTSRTSQVLSSASSSKEITDPSQLCPTTEGKCQEINIRVENEHTSQVMSTSLEPERGVYNGSLTSHHREWKEFDGSSSDEFDKFLRGRSPQIELCSDGVQLEVENSVVEETPNAAEGDIQSDFSDIPIDSCKNSKFSEDIKIDILEGIVEAAKNHKKTLFLEVESIMNKIKEVELQEKIAEQAKEEAAKAGVETLVKVDELKQMLAHAKEANDMHGGEVYGERSILATEVRELQARLLNLSDERDNALAILHEMHQTLEARLAGAEELKKSAEKQKLEKEESAQNALAEQEAIMAKVVQESKILQQEAEENSKLLEFLTDRGRVIDTLQGEISVICHDVRLLKEKFDERVPLSKSISSSQTSCILASSVSSIKSMASDLVLESREMFMSPNKERSPASSIDGQSPYSKQQKKRINFEEDDWEFFE